MIITYTKTGMKITHPTGVVQVITKIDTLALIERQKKVNTTNENKLNAFKTMLAEIEKA